MFLTARFELYLAATMFVPVMIAVGIVLLCVLAGLVIYCWIKSRKQLQDTKDATAPAVIIPSGIFHLTLSKHFLAWNYCKHQCIEVLDQLIIPAGSAGFLIHRKTDSKYKTAITLAKLMRFRSFSADNFWIFMYAKFLFSFILWF